VTSNGGGAERASAVRSTNSGGARRVSWQLRSSAAERQCSEECD